MRGFNLLLLWFLIGFCHCGLSQAQGFTRSPTRIRTGIVLTVNAEATVAYDYNIVRPALEAAYQRSADESNVIFEPIPCLYSGGCNTPAAVGQTFICINQSVDFIIGPGCSDDLMMALELQTAYFIPSVTGAGDLVDSTAKFPYVTRCSYNTYTQWMFFINMCLEYSWTNVVVIYNLRNSVKAVNAASLVKNLRTNGIRYTEYPFDGTKVKEVEQYQIILNNASKNARVFVILAVGKIVRDVMIAAGRNGQIGGDFVFLTLDPFRDDILKDSGWKQGDKYDEEAKNAFGVLLVLTVHSDEDTTEYQEFAALVEEKSQALFPGYPATLNYYVASFFDSVLLYARAVNETVEEGRSIGKDNIDELAKKYWNRTFPGAAGPVYINPLGDRNDDHAIYDMDMDGEFLITAVFYGFKVIQVPNYRFDQLRPFDWGNHSHVPPPNEPRCGYNGDNPVCDHTREILGVALSVVAVLLVLSMVAGIVIYQRARRRAELAQFDLFGTWRDVTKPRTNHPKTKKVAKESTTIGSHTSLHVNNMLENVERYTGETVHATFKEQSVILRMCENRSITITRSLLHEIKTARALEASSSVLGIRGFCTGPGRTAVMYAPCTKGSIYSKLIAEEIQEPRMSKSDHIIRGFWVRKPAIVPVLHCPENRQDMLAGDDFALDWFFKFAFIKDIVAGLQAVQSSTLGYHGRLASKCCFIDAYFVTKVADYGLPSFFVRAMPTAQDRDFCASLLWTAPEHLPRPFDTGSPEGDVYSFAIILQEIIMREKPYGSSNMDPEVILAKLQKRTTRNFRPKVDNNLCPPEISVLMRQCWADNPLERPRLAQIRSVIKDIERNHASHGSILDALVHKMENYTHDLEVIVQEKAHQFLMEKEKSEQLLYQILPRTVVDQLKRGEQVKPENFDSVTVSYQDIVSFTTLSSQSSPTEVVDLLNDLYTIFDNCILKFDAYKVETIGDCYVVASGVPIRNGNNHAAEMCRLSLLLLNQIRVFKIRHRPNEQLRLRLGAHTGPCVSGVVGLVMPRFCLFGETITIAGKMESSSQPMKVQISLSCEKMLQSVGKFDTELRDTTVRINEKLEITTYWLKEELF